MSDTSESTALSDKSCANLDHMLCQVEHHVNVSFCFCIALAVRSTVPSLSIELRSRAEDTMHENFISKISNVLLGIQRNHVTVTQSLRFHSFFN